MTFHELLHDAQQKLIDKGFESVSAKQDCEEILMYICRCSKTELILKSKEIVNSNILLLFNNAINERIKHKPIQYITHNSLFCGYNFFVNEDCLIPRVDSEILVENAIKIIKNDDSIKNKNEIAILDLCCGSGCLGISLINMLKTKIIKDKKLHITFVDKSNLAMQIAKINCQKFNINAKFIVSDILINGLGIDKYDIILCNPPYIETKIIETLQPEVKNFEPHMALDGGEDGMKFYKFLSLNIKNNMRTSAKVFLEIGYNQAINVKEIFQKQNFNISLIKDYGNNYRCLILTL